MASGVHGPKRRQADGGQRDGYTNAVNAPPGGNRSVSELAAGEYIPRLLLEDFNRRVVRTYLYELIDERANPAGDQPDAHFGLLRNDGTEKPAYRAVQATLRLLSDPGPLFAPGALDYTLTGDTDQVHSTAPEARWPVLPGTLGRAIRV